jgi:hypothetical protein
MMYVGSMCVYVSMDGMEWHWDWGLGMGWVRCGPTVEGT